MTTLVQEQRKLAAIMFTDMVGYSAAAQKNEALALELLEEHRQLLRSLFPRFDGREIETAGDAFFVEFSSTLRATQCAIAIQKLLHDRNQATASDKAIRLRIGLHVGDVVVRGSNVLGDGVNIAARIEPLAQPEGICVSEDVARQIQNKIDVRLHKLAKSELKNIQLPVEIYAIELPWTVDGHTASAQLADPVLDNLPAQTTLFIGREKEVEAVRQLLLTDSVRLVTLTGPGGTGKTRLGLQVAASLRDEFRHGVCLVVLAPVNDPDLVVSEIAATLGVRDSGAEPLLDAVKDFLHERRLLLFIDNFEQVISAAPVVAAMLASCPSIKVLVTSREPLHVSAEQEFFVPPLNLPDIKQLPAFESLSQYAAVRLFIQRALAVKPDFSITNENAPAVAEICYRLDGLPLAIELAAARIKLLSPQAMLSRLGSKFEFLQGGLRDKPARHQTLRQAIAWSHDLLSPDERTLFRRLAVFTGGCSLEAVESVCNPDNSLAISTLDGIAALVDKSLLRQNQATDSQPHFTMLETIREFALDALQQSSDYDSTLSAHAHHFVDLAEKAEQRLTGPDQSIWLDMLEQMHDNLRAVLLFAEKTGDAELGCRLGGALWRFWIIRGYMGEGRSRLLSLLSLPDSTKRSNARAKALNGVGTILHESGDLILARGFLEESLEIWREAGNKKGVGTVINNLCVVEGLLGNVETAKQLADESLILHKEVNDKRGIAVALHNMAWIVRVKISLANQSALFEQALVLRKEIGDERGIAYEMANIAWIERFRGNYDKATQLVEQSLAILAKVGDKQISAWAIGIKADILRDHGHLDQAAAYVNECIESLDKAGNNFASTLARGILGAIAFRQGNFALARELLDVALTRIDRLSLAWGITEVLCYSALLAVNENDFERAMKHVERAFTVLQKLDDQVGLAFALESVVRMLMIRKRFPGAVTLLAHATHIRSAAGAPLPPIDQPFYEETRTVTRAAMGSKAFEEAWTHGESMSLGEAIECALREGRSLHAEG